jgi:hypothetical protein
VHGRVLAVGDGLIETLPGFFAPNERWQAAMLAGFPIYADPNKAFWYPLRLLRYIPNGFNAYIVTGYAVAAWATYGYVRSVTGVVVAGITSAVAFSCGGFLISHFGHPMIVQPTAWACVAVSALDSYLRTRKGWPLAGMAIAEILCFAAGQPQIATFTVVLLVSYLIWNGYVRQRRETIRIYLEGMTAIILGVAAAGFAWIPTIVQGTLSVRSGLGFNAFVADSLPANHLLRMLTYPFAAGGGADAIYHGAIVPAEAGAFTETACYVALATLALAPLAPFAGQRRVALFWIGTACIALTLAVGDALPIAALTYQMPGFNLFRIPGRHAFEFTLAVAILGGLGVAAIARGAERRVVLYAGMLAAATIGALATVDVASQDPGFLQRPAVAIFLVALAAQLVLLLATTFVRASPHVQAAIACGAVVVGGLPFEATAYWLDAPSARVLEEPGYVRLLARLPLQLGQRVYTASEDAALDLQPNLPTIWGVPDIGGYSPVQFSIVQIFLQTAENGRLLNVTSPLVDLAGVEYFAVPSHPEHGIDAAERYDRADLGAYLSIARPNAPRSLTFGLARPRRADQLALVTALGESVEVQQGTTVAIVTLRPVSGTPQSIPLRAGFETAEFAYDRPDVAASVRHRRGRLYERYGLNSWYECLLPARVRKPISSVQIRIIDQNAALNVRKISLIDGPSKRAYPLSGEALYLGDPRHFRRVAEIDGVALFENLRSSPTVWIANAVPSIIDLSNNAALAAFRERLGHMDLRRYAPAVGVPAMTSVRGSAQLVRYEAEHRGVSVHCPAACLLVSNTTFTTDWRVEIDGRPGRLVRVDGFLQGVVVPSGSHRVEFSYEPLAERAGIALTGLSAALSLTWMLARLRRERYRPSTPAGTNAQS